MRRDRDRGISLLNVLVVVAASAGLVQAMLTGQEGAVNRLGTTRDAAQARALARGGVMSVAVALRRDLKEAPETDHLAEPWAQAAQDAIAFDAGTYAVVIGDLRARFDLNALGPANLTELRVFGALLEQLDLPATLAPFIAAIIAEAGPLARPDDLIRHGVSRGDLARLTPHVTALGTRHPLNLNTADDVILTALFGNAVAAQNVLARRAAKGFVDRSDLAAFGLVAPPFGGFTSDAFEVAVTAQTGTARTRLTRHILRDAETGEMTILPAP
ncbi:MAG: general secretion pathway protein GspK [Marinibacterium sp.]